MKWGPTEDNILIGYKDGSVKLYDVLLKEYADVIKEPQGEGPVVGAGCIGNKIIFCRGSGHVNICCDDSTDMFKMNFGDEVTLTSMECNENRKNVIGTGGERNDFKLWDIEVKKCIFNAKSVSFTKQVIQLKVWVCSYGSSILFAIICTYRRWYLVIF